MAAGFMLIMGLGRLGAWASQSQSNALPTSTYGWLLTIFGATLLASIPWRRRKRGRLVAGLAAILLAGMAWDIGAINTTFLLELGAALCLVWEALANHDCE
jgi:hypothetical protein